MKPAAVDLFCGLGGWTEGLLAEGYRVVGIDIEEHVYGEHKYPGKLILADVLTLHGSLFARADLIVASPPCQEYSYMAMPWSRAKAKAAAIRADTTGKEHARLTQLFNACFRIQREASDAAGRHIPLVVENVRGAQPWVGKAQGNFGSFYLWGDVPELPKAVKASKVPGFRFDGSGKSFQSASVEGTKVAMGSWRHPDDPRHVSGLGFNTHAARNLRGEKGVGPKWDRVTKSGAHGMARWTNPSEGTKNGNDWFGSGENCSEQRRHGSNSNARKFASAMIAKIPLVLSRHIATTFKPVIAEVAE